MRGRGRERDEQGKKRKGEEGGINRKEINKSGSGGGKEGRDPLTVVMALVSVQ